MIRSDIRDEKELSKTCSPKGIGKTYMQCGENNGLFVGKRAPDELRGDYLAPLFFRCVALSNCLSVPIL